MNSHSKRNEHENGAGSGGAAPPAADGKHLDQHGLAALIEVATDGLALLDEQAVIRFVSPAVETLLGYAPSDLVGRVFFELVHPDDTPRVVELFEVLLQGQDTVSTELRYRHLNGSWRWMSGTGINRLDDPRLRGIVLSYHDVTSRRLTEQALRESEDRFKAFMDNNPALAWMKDEQLRYVYFNAPFADRFGVRLDDWLGKTDWEVWPNVAEQVRRNDLAVLSQGTAVEVIEIVPDPDGTLRHSLVYKFPMHDALGRRFVGGIAVDLTERLQAEQALRESDERNRLLFELNPEAILIARDEQIVYVNRAAVQLLAADGPDDLVGRSLLEFVAPDGHDAVRQRLAVLPEAGDGTPLIEEQWVRCDGVTIDVEVVASRFRLDGESAVQVLVRDITERKRTARALRDAEEQLRQNQKLESMGRLAGGVAHDFNNILTIINCHSDFLLQQLRSDDPVVDAIREVKQACERAASLTRQLLTFSRKQVVSNRVFELNQTVSALVPMLRRLIRANIGLSTELEADGCIRADPSQIEQVILNLVVNARDAIPDSGSLSIRTYSTTITPSQTTAPADLSPGPYCVLAVSDTGCGMDEQTQSRVFEPFFTSKPDGQGTGLGLATVYGIARQCGGAVTVVSRPGEGTTFEVYLPCAPRPEVASAPPPIAGEVPRGSETVLLVEDDDLVRRLTGSILRRSGYTVLDAGDGHAALDLARAHPGPIDLLLTDYMLPRMNGRQLAERFAERHPQAPVVYMSGYTDDDAVLQGFFSAGSTFVPKPFSAETLQRAVRETLDRDLPRRNKGARPK